MSYPIISVSVANTVLFSALILIWSFTFTDEPRTEQARFFTVDSPQLEWGPCPKFLPEGCEIAVLHGKPSEKNADVFFKVLAGSVIPRHWHTSAERMILVSGELHLTYDGQETEILRPGSYAYGPAKLPHQGSCAKGGPCILFIAFELPIDAVPVENASN